MAAGLMDVKFETVETTTLLDRLGQSLQRSIMTFASINIINKVKGSIGEAYGYVKNLDTSLNEIRIVTGKSADEMDRFAEKANKAAASLGKATTDYTKASTIFYQQGLSDQDVLARTETTMKVSNTTGTDTKAVADNLTALWNGFNVGAEDAEKAVDVVAAVAAKTASNLDEMTTAMSKVASMANSMGVSEE
jgi:TP901 family phage tail tape measure protein